MVWPQGGSMELYLMTTVCCAASYVQAERGKVICQKPHRQPTHISIFSIFTFFTLIFVLIVLILNYKLHSLKKKPLATCLATTNLFYEQIIVVRSHLQPEMNQN